MADYDKVRRVYGKPLQNASQWLRKEFWTRLWKNLTQSLVWENQGNAGEIDVWWENFKLFDIHNSEDAQQQINSIQRILDAHWSHMRENDSILATSYMNRLKNELQKFWNEFTDYLTMDRAKFLAQTNNVGYLNEIVDNLSSDWSDLAKKLVSIAQNRLAELT